MGLFSSWSYTSHITIWPVTNDEFAQPTYGPPYTLNGTWVEGGDAVRGDNGVEVHPKATYYMEGAVSERPEEQWAIAVGEFVSDPPLGVDLIKRVVAYDNSLFQSGSLVDYTVVT